MTTYNIGFYEDLTKIIFELSSNIIKYAPYFFCCTRVAVPEEIRGVISANSGFTNFEDCLGCSKEKPLCCFELRDFCYFRKKRNIFDVIFILKGILKHLQNASH